MINFPTEIFRQFLWRHDAETSQRWRCFWNIRLTPRLQIFGGKLQSFTRYAMLNGFPTVLRHFVFWSRMEPTLMPKIKKDERLWTWRQNMANWMNQWWICLFGVQARQRNWMYPNWWTIVKIGTLLMSKTQWQILGLKRCLRNQNHTAQVAWWTFYSMEAVSAKNGSATDKRVRQRY